MFDLSKFRWPYREDSLFSVLALLILVVPLVFAFKIYENFETAKFILWLILIGAAVILFWLKKETQPESSSAQPALPANVWMLKGNRAFFMLAGSFLLWCLLSVLHSVDWLNSVYGFYYRFTSGLLFYASWLVFLILLVKTLTWDRLEFLAKILVFSGLLVAVVGFLQSSGVGYYEGLEDPGFVRAPSLLGNPDFTAMFLVGTLPLAAALLFLSKSFAGKLYYFIAAFFMVLANMVLASRGAILGLAASLLAAVFLLVFARFKVKHRWLIVLGIVLSLGLGLALVEFSRPQAISSILNFSDANVHTRLVDWRASFYGLTHHPFLGVGPGNYHVFFEQYRQRFLDGSIFVFDDAHNLFLQMGVTTGLPFLLSFLGLVLMSATAGLKIIKRDKNILAIGCLTGMTGLLIAGCFSPFTIPNFLLLAVFLAGGIFSVSKEYPFRLPNAIKAIGVLGGVFLLTCGVSLLVAEYLFTYAYRAYYRGNYSLAYDLSRAAKTINPTNQLYYIYQTGSEIKLNRPPEEIISHIGQVIRLHPTIARSRIVAANLYASLYWQTNDYKYLRSAVAEIGESFTQDRYTAGAYQRLGWYYFQLGEIQKSKDSLMEGLKIQDNHLPSWMLLAKIYQLQNNRPQVISSLERAYAANPDLPQLRGLLQIAKAEPDVNKIPIQITIGEGVLE
jgi:O-antigen ligase